MRVKRGANFWDRLDKSKGPNGCWLWLDQKDPKGYGKLRVNKRDWKAHRYAVYLTMGKEPDANSDVMHLCHTPACCNPSHLQLGSRGENVRMSATAGRLNKGLARRFVVAKLTPETLALARRLVELGVSQNDIAARLGVHQSTISRAVRQKSFSSQQGA